jgi:hypothetical protein
VAVAGSGLPHSDVVKTTSYSGARVVAGEERAKYRCLTKYLLMTSSRECCKFSSNILWLPLLDLGFPSFFQDFAAFL